MLDGDLKNLKVSLVHNNIRFRMRPISWKGRPSDGRLCAVGSMRRIAWHATHACKAPIHRSSAGRPAVDGAGTIFHRCGRGAYEIDDMRSSLPPGNVTEKTMILGQ